MKKERNTSCNNIKIEFAIQKTNIRQLDAKQVKDPALDIVRRRSTTAERNVCDKLHPDDQDLTQGRIMCIHHQEVHREVFGLESC